MLIRNLIVMSVCLSVVCGVARGADENDDRQKLQGTWTFVKPAGGDSTKKDGPVMRVTFKDDTIAFAADEKQPQAKGTYKIDPSKNPKTMDITLEKGGQKSLVQSIYELDGDTLKLCHYLGARASKEHPPKLAADKQTVLGILKRDKK